MPLSGAQDTSEDARRVLRDGWRRMSPHDKVTVVDAWSRDVRALALAGVDIRHPGAGPVERLIHLGRALYGEDVITDAVVDALQRRMGQ